MAGIHSIFGKHRSAQQVLHVTSVKANIGHLEAAAGSAGLAKVLLMLRENKIPPQISSARLNPRFPDLASENIRVGGAGVEAWRSPGHGARRALLNSFGAAGSNAAIILQEAPQRRTAKQAEKRTAYNFNVTAKRERDVEQYCARYLAMLESSPETPLEDVCYTATARRQVYDYRLSLVCHSTQDLIQQLRTRSKPMRCTSRKTPYMLVFSGQGAFYPGMGKGLMAAEPVFRDCVKRCDAIVTALGYKSVLPMICHEHAPQDMLEEILSVQLAGFCVEYALAAMWWSWNIRPAIVIGHR